MNLRFFALAALPCALLAFAACGDGPDDAETTPSADATRTPGGIPEDFGPAPKLGGNIDGITPEHGQKVTQFDTRSPDPGRPRGLCAQVNFKDLGGQDTLRWFRMAYDGVEVTPELTWIVAPETGDRSGGRVCYAPDKGFTVGKHTAAISVADPNNVNVPAKQTIGWAFEVTE